MQSLISPIGKTPEQAKRPLPLFATSPYSIRTQSPVQLQTQPNADVFTQIHSHARYEQYLQQREREKDVTPLKRIYFQEQHNNGSMNAQTHSLALHARTHLQTHLQNHSLASHAHTYSAQLQQQQQNTKTTAAAPPRASILQRS